MMRQYELVERVQRYDPDADEALLNRAYVYAMRAHGNQTRASGDPYFSHPLEVAAILTDLKLDDATIAVALLHDTIEDTEATQAEIDKLFGPEIGKLVQGLTKLKKLDLISSKARQGENLRKLLLAIADDVRVLLVKLADRLHNMRTLGVMRGDKQARIAQETMEIYAPLAGRIGMQEMRNELEELSFKILHPEHHQMICERLEEIREKNGELTRAIEDELTDKLAERGIRATVKGREKKPYSIFNKMQRKQIGFEQLSDIFGFRIIVDEPDVCYRALGVVHRLWSAVPGRFKDYISTPKDNDYRSIHTTVIGPRRQRVELQIRTREMDEIAEYGIAAHALYKDDGSGGSRAEQRLRDTRALAWIRRTVELLDSDEGAEDFLENTKLELFQDQVFCFTPKGKVIALPRGATPIDFAYEVHTGVGNTCVGCKVNGRMVPLVTKLENGDEVEIVTSPAQTPLPSWEQIAITGKARGAIRRATRNAVRKQYSGLGKGVLDRAFRKAGFVLDEKRLELVMVRLAHKALDDLYAAVGRGELASEDVLKAVYPDTDPAKRAGPAPDSADGWFGLKRATNLQFRIPGLRRKDHSGAASSLPILGVKGDMQVRFAPDGGAIPGDRIVGIMNPGEGITIYPIHSPSLSAFENEPERWLDVRWDLEADSDRLFSATINVSAINEPGTLAEIAGNIAETGANVDNLLMTRRGSDFTDMRIEIEVRDVKHLNRILALLRSNAVVSSAERHEG